MRRKTPPQQQQRVALCSCCGDVQCAIALTSSVTNWPVICLDVMQCKGAVIVGHSPQSITPTHPPTVHLSPYPISKLGWVAHLYNGATHKNASFQSNRSQG